MKRKPLLPVNRYAQLKHNTIKYLRRLERAGKLTPNEIRRQKQMFLINAERLGIVQEAADEDFETEIRWRVK